MKYLLFLILLLLPISMYAYNVIEEANNTDIVSNFLERIGSCKDCIYYYSDKQEGELPDLNYVTIEDDFGNLLIGFEEIKDCDFFIKGLNCQLLFIQRYVQISDGVIVSPVFISTY